RRRELHRATAPYALDPVKGQHHDRERAQDQTEPRPRTHVVVDPRRLPMPDREHTERTADRRTGHGQPREGPAPGHQRQQREPDPEHQRGPDEDPRRQPDVLEAHHPRTAQHIETARLTGMRQHQRYQQDEHRARYHHGTYPGVDLPGDPAFHRVQIVAVLLELLGRLGRVHY